MTLSERRGLALVLTHLLAVVMFVTDIFGTRLKSNVSTAIDSPAQQYLLIVK